MMRIKGIGLPLGTHGGDGQGVGMGGSGGAAGGILAPLKGTSRGLKDGHGLRRYRFPIYRLLNSKE